VVTATTTTTFISIYHKSRKTYLRAFFVDMILAKGGGVVTNSQICYIYVSNSMLITTLTYTYLK